MLDCDVHKWVGSMSWELIYIYHIMQVHIYNGRPGDLKTFKEALREVEETLTTPVHTWSPDFSTVRVNVGFSLTSRGTIMMIVIELEAEFDEGRDCFGGVITEMQARMALLHSPTPFTWCLGMPCLPKCFISSGNG